MADCLKLLIEKDAATGRIALALVGPDGVETQGTLDPAQYSGGWALDEVHKKLNDPAARLQAEALGRGLFERLVAAATPMRKTWNDLTAQHGADPLELHIDEIGLRGYPWELLWDSNDHRYARVGGIVRRTTTPSKAAPASSQWPFRLLVVVGTDDSKLPGQDQIGAARETGFLRRALADYGRSIDINVLLLPTRPALQEALKDYQPHVVHFIGHGTHDLGSGRNCLVIENATDTWNWDTVGIAEDFAVAGCVPEFVFLNCCRSGSDHAANFSLQQTFTEKVGVGAVVAMQADVRGDKAVAFSRAFYGHALAGPHTADFKLPTIVAAVREGRRAIGSDAEIGWALPALTFCENVPVDQRLLKRHKWPTQASFLVCREFDEARVYADESDSRRRMIQWFYPIKGEPEPNVLILRGPTTSGKSRLLHWCMESWAAEGVRLRYLPVDLPRGKNCLQWLIRLRAGELSTDSRDSERFLRAGLDLQPFLPFYDAVARAAQILDGPTRIEDQLTRIRLIDTLAYEVADDVSIGPFCARFLEGLDAIGKLTIVLDQLSIGAIDRVLFSGFRDSFLAPIARNPKKDIRIAVAVSRDDYDRFELSALDAQSTQVVSLRSDYTLEQLEELAVEALRYRAESKVRGIAQKALEVYDFGTGLARLSFCQTFLNSGPFRDLGRMQ